MDKKTSLLCFFLFIISLPSLSFAQDKVTVIAEKANIYAEPHERAHLIESVKKGTVLTLFQKGIIRDAWYYVSFYSQRYRGRTTGFIRVEQVGPWSETAQPEIQPPPPPEPEAKKEPEVRAEESQTATLLPSPKVLSLPQEETELREHIWLSIDLEYTDTAVPMPMKMSLPTQHSLPLDRSWRTTETESAFTQLPARQILEPLEVQDTLKTETYAESTPPPQPQEKPETSLKPTRTSYSKNIQLTRTGDTIEFSLLFGPYSNFRHFELNGPNRIVVDFFNVSEYADLQQHQINDMGIESIRIAMFEETTARVVFDFPEEIPAYQIEETDDGLRLLFWAEAAGPREQAETQPPQKPPDPEPKKEPETKTKELSADTGLPTPRAWTLPLELTVLTERAWTAREEISTDTALPPGLALHLPLIQPPSQARFRTVPPSPSAPIPKKTKEDIVEKPELKPPVEEPPKKVEKEKVEVKPEKVEPEQVIPKPPVVPQARPPRETGPVTLSLGVGASTGGAGGFFQYNTKAGLALHAGIGMYPTSFIYSDTDWVKNEMLYSVGVKYYLPFKSQYLRPYVDVQYGGFTIEAVQIIVGIWEYQYIYQNEQKALYGPTALVGGEVRLGTLGLNLAAGVSYATTAWEWKSQDLYFAFDFSLIYTFK